MPVPAKITRPAALALTGVPRAPEITMPFMVLSLNGATTLPCTGHAHSMSPSLRVAVASGLTAGFSSGLASALAAGCLDICAYACSLYGTRWPNGSRLTLGSFATAGGMLMGLISATAGVGGVTGVAVTPSGAVNRSCCPTRMLAGSSILFHAARSRTVALLALAMLNSVSPCLTV